jgi:2-keto-4-pentenoate hydratase/2-oxohepta-3-ene-1,7-dioic acid hydratase in catechol pathway
VQNTTTDLMITAVPDLIAYISTICPLDPGDVIVTGTPGGVGEFLGGLAMAVAGGYWLTNQVSVTSGYWRPWGYNGFGL